MLETATCAACGAAGLVPHLSVAGERGEDGLIPTTDRFGTALGDIVRCRHCGHMQLEPMPDPSMLADAYGQASSMAYIDEEAGQRETARRSSVMREARDLCSISVAGWGSSSPKRPSAAGARPGSSRASSPPPTPGSACD
jgi:hypothetical protein